MRIESTNVYVGPNLFARFPVIRHVLDLGELEDWPTVRLGEEFIEALLSCLPGLHEHGCSYKEPGGFIRRMREDEGTWLGHVMEHVAIELQVVAGSDVTFGRTRSIDGRPGFYNMVFQYKDAEVGREASKLALDLLGSLLPAELKFDGAPGIRAEYGFAGQSGRRAGHSMAATQSIFARSIRAWPLPAAHPGDNDGADQQYCRRTRVR
jgi:cyanophycin synthetase